MAEDDRYTEKAMTDHRRTYARMISMFKWLIILSALALLFLLAFCS